MSALRLINETTVSSDVRTINVTDVFSDDFDIYKVTISLNYSTSSSQEYIDLRAITSSGSVISSTDYRVASLVMLSDATFQENRSASETRYRYVGYADNAANGSATTVWFFNPTNNNSYTGIIAQGMSYRASDTDTVGTKAIGNLYQASKITGFQVFPNTSDISNAVIRTYGLRIDK